MAGSGSASSEPGKGRGMGLAVPRCENGGREALGGGASSVADSRSVAGEVRRSFVEQAALRSVEVSSGRYRLYYNDINV